MEDKLETEFNRVCEIVKTNTSLKVDNSQKLQFYGLFKVITVGPINESNKNKEGWFDFTTKYKNEAWTKCSILSKKEAMVQYIKLYSEISGEKIDLNLENLGGNGEKKIIFDFPKDLDAQGIYSSGFKKEKEEAENFLKTRPEQEKKFKNLRDMIYQGDLITEETIVEFEKENSINLVDFRDNLEQSVLHICVDATNFSAVDALIKLKYAEKLVNTQDNIGMTPMHIGAVNFDLHIYDLLTMINGVDYKIKDNEGKTCKDYLKENNECEIPKKYMREDE